MYALEGSLCHWLFKESCGICSRGKLTEEAMEGGMVVECEQKLSANGNIMSRSARKAHNNH